MKKTLILVVDRDNDFGRKGGVATPVIGREGCEKAAMSLAMADPEDSDVNTVLAALSIHKEMSEEGADVEMALLCGDSRVGFKSDAIVAEELENVLDDVQPDRVILVSDGAEDEYIYPLISSRAKIDSVRRVFVKQAPGVEGTLYILLRMIQDDDKRKRFLIPLGVIFLVLGLFSVLPDLVALAGSGNLNYLSGMTGGVLMLILGTYIISYAYKLDERLLKFTRNIKAMVRSGNQVVPFTIVAIILFFAGLILGILAATEVQGVTMQYRGVLFLSSVLWMWLFSIICYETGKALNFYLTEQKVKHNFLVTTLTLFAIAFILQGAMDAFSLTMGYIPVREMLIVLELTIGFGFAVLAGLMQSSFRVLIKDLIAKYEA